MISKQPFGTLDGREIFKYVLSDKISVEIVTCGATLVACRVPNRDGGMTDVLLSMKTPQEIISTPSYMGSVVGRCANRICDGKFTLGDKQYQLATNDGKAHLHGGECGFNKKVFQAQVQEGSLVLSSCSCDGEENYPGNLNFSVKYTVYGSTLEIEYFAVADSDTLFNPTNHAYFNLNGENSANILDTVVQIFADKFLPVDANKIPTGEVLSVAATPFDFTIPKTIGCDIFAECDQLRLCGGYDHNFCLTGSHAAFAYSQQTGITLDCYTDMPGLQFYTGNFLCENGKSQYGKRSGFCLETQYFPNAINNPHWKQPILKKGEKFYSKTSYVFGIK